MIAKNEISRFRDRIINEEYNEKKDWVLRRQREGLTKPYLHIESLYEAYLELAHYDLYLNTNESSCVSYLQKAAECNNAIYTLALHENSSVTLSLDGFDPLTIPGKVNNGFIVPWEFVTQLRLMMLLRRKDIIKIMLNIPESLFNPGKAGLSGPEYHYVFYRVVKSFLLKAKPDKELLADIGSCQQIMKEAADDQVDDYLSYYITFELNILKGIITQDSTLLNKWLETRLLQIKEYYKDNTSHPFSLFALRDAGWAALCHDLGFQISVKSDYLPEFLVKGAFTKEK